MAGLSRTADVPVCEKTALRPEEVAGASPLTTKGQRNSVTSSGLAARPPARRLQESRTPPRLPRGWPDRVEDSDIQEHAQQEQDYTRDNHLTSFQEFAAFMPRRTRLQTPVPGRFWPAREAGRGPARDAPLSVSERHRRRWEWLHRDGNNDVGSAAPRCCACRSEGGDPARGQGDYSCLITWINASHPVHRTEPWRRCEAAENQQTGTL